MQLKERSLVPAGHALAEWQPDRPINIIVPWVE
jgi:hypothetical protein